MSGHIRPDTIQTPLRQIIPDVDEEPRDRLVLWQPREVLGSDLTRVFVQLPRQPYRVVGADLESDDRANVTEDGIRGLLIELRQALVGNDQREAVLAGLAEVSTPFGCRAVV